MKSAGVEVRPLLNLLDEEWFNELVFDNVRVPRDELVGGENRGWEVLTSALGVERITIYRAFVHKGTLPQRPRAAGVGAEIAVGSELIDGGWEVEYFGNQRGIGYDLRATRGQETVHVEVKSSVAYCTPELTEEEWRAANHHGPEYVVAVVDFYGTENQRIKYLRDPVSNVEAESIERTTYRLPRQGVSELAVESEFL